MYRYFVLIWNRLDEGAASAANLIAARLQSGGTDWGKVVDEPGVLAFHAGESGGSSRTRSLWQPGAQSLGAVFGTLFRRGYERDTMGAPRRMDAEESRHIAETRGAHLIGHYWGRYVAVVRSHAGRDVSVIRDPTGAIPCLVTSWRGVNLVFSDMESCIELALLSFSVNWKYIAGYVAYSALQIQETGLNEVTEVQAGERLIFTAAGAVERTLLWNPATVAERAPIENPKEAVAAVRETVHDCIHAWASLHRKVVHNLSGGLDSSIVLSCLKNAPTRPEVTCLHYFSPSSNEDERKFARTAASHCNAELIEQPLHASEVKLEKLLQIRRGAKPWFYVYDLVHSPVEARALSEHGATAIFSGSSGDGLFLQARAELSVADFFHRHGLRFGAFTVARDASRVTRKSLWPILSQGLELYLKRSRANRPAEWGHGRSLIPAEVMSVARANEELIHPWLRAAGTVSPGLLWHILCLSVPPGFYESFGGVTDIERTTVLFSQPLIESCLRIPSYVWITGGWDRAIARRAFADALPPVIIRRRNKGSIDRYNLMMLDANRNFVREMLLDGLLVRAGLLDRHKLDAYLAPGHIHADFEYNDIARHHLCTEIWLRRWSEVKQRAAVA